MKRNSIAFLVLASLALSACGAAFSDKSSKEGASASVIPPGSGGPGDPVAIIGFSPSAGSVASLPSSVVVSFTSSNLDQAGLSAVSAYTVTCGNGNPIVAQGVSPVAGVASVTVSLPAITGLAPGTVCTFNISNNLRDGFGNYINGDHFVNYTVTGSVSGGLWTPSSTLTTTAAAGDAFAGSTFSGTGGANMALKGLLLSGSQYVDGVVGAWSAFGDSSVTYGPLHGYGVGGYTQLLCPSGYRMTGIYGRAGSYIDAVGIVCKSESQSQTYTSGVVGGPGGTAFELSCPLGQFATDLKGRAGSYLNQLYLGCR